MFEKLKLKLKIKKLEKQAKAGDDQAMYDLALIYLDGTIIKSNKQRANELMKHAAEKGNLQAKTYLISNKISKGADIVSKAVSDIKKLKKSK